MSSQSGGLYSGKMKTESEGERMRQRERERKRRTQTEWVSASLLRWFPMKLILIPPEISHCPLSPLRPASITYLSRGWMIYTLPMSTADRYTHHWLLVLWDFADMLKSQSQNRMGWGKVKQSKLVMEMSIRTRQSIRVREKPPKVQGWKGVKAWLTQQMGIAGDNRGNELVY